MKLCAHLPLVEKSVTLDAGAFYVALCMFIRNDGRPILLVSEVEM